MGLGQYDGHGEYCGPHTASSVFLILVLVPYAWSLVKALMGLHASELYFLYINTDCYGYNAFKTCKTTHTTENLIIEPESWFSAFSTSVIPLTQ